MVKLAFTKSGGVKKAPVFSKQDGTGIPIATGAGAVYHYHTRIESDNSFEDRFKEPYKHCKIIDRRTTHPKVLLPRMKRPLGKIDLREEGDDINITMQMPPKNEEQKEVCEEMEELHYQNRTGYIINASTGFGKTYLGCYGISLIQKTTLILVHKADLEKQWRESLKKFLGLESEDIGLIKGDVCSVAGKAVVIGYVQSLMKDKRYPTWAYNYFGFVIADEVHIMGADIFINCIYQLPALHRLGLSATTDRADHKAHVFKDHIGPVMIKAENLPMPFNVMKIDTGVVIPEGLYFKPGRMMTLCNWFAKHRPRQKLISAYIKKAYKADRTVICFADTLKHLDFAFDCLIDAGVKQKEIGRYHGGLTEAQLKAGAFKPIVLVTYKFTSVGTDFPHWDTAVFMTPKADVRQMVGRIVREAPDKKIPLVFDFVDNHHFLTNYYKSRKKWYSQKANIIREY